MIVVQICLSDIPAASRRQDKNGKWWAGVVVDERRSVDNYGNTHSVSMSQTKEERDAKTPKVWVGSGKEFKFSSSQGGARQESSQPYSGGSTYQATQPKTIQVGGRPTNPDDLPF